MMAISNLSPPRIRVSADFLAIVVPGVALGFLVGYDWERPAWPSVVGVGGIGLSILDLLCLLVTGIALVRIGTNLESIRVSLLLALIMAFTAAFALSIAVGVTSNGKAAVAAETRPWFQLAAVFFWVIVLFQTAPKSLVRNLLMAISWGLVFFALTHMAARGLGRADEIFVGSDGIDRSTRILRSGQAMFLACCGIAALDYGMVARRLASTAAGVTFISIALLSQNRSVWIAVCAALACYALVAKSISWEKAILPAIVSGLLLFAFYLTDAGRSFTSNIAGQLNNRSTYDDRRIGWDYLIAKSRDGGLLRIIFGQPVGSGWARPGDVGTVGYQPHNWYLTVYLRTGVAGLAILALVILIIAGVLIARRDALGVAWAVGLLVYGWAYGYSWYLGVILGLIVVRVIAVPSRRNEFVHRPPNNAKSESMLTEATGRYPS